MSGSTDKAATPTQPKTAIGRRDDALTVILEAQDYDGRPSHPTPIHQSKQDFATDLSSDDQKRCSSAEQCNILYNALTSTRSRLRTQSRRIRRVKKSVLKIQKLVQDLHVEKLVTEEGRLELDVVLNSILDHLNCKS